MIRAHLENESRKKSRHITSLCGLFGPKQLLSRIPKEKTTWPKSEKSQPMDTEYLEESPSIPPSVNVQISHHSEIDFLNMDSSAMHGLHFRHIHSPLKKET